MKFFRLVPFFLTLSFCLGCSAQSATPDSAQTNRRIQNQLRQTMSIPPQWTIEIGARTPSEFAGYETLPVTFSNGTRKQTRDFLVSKDNKTLLIMDKFDLSKDVMSSIDLSGRPVRGNKDARVTIISFDDFQCPYCSVMHRTLFPKLLHDYGDKIRVIYKDYPLFQIHPWAIHAAVDANCLAAQSNDAYWSFADVIHDDQQSITGPRDPKRPLDDQFKALDQAAREQGSKFQLDQGKLQACVNAQDESAVKASLQEGTELGVDSTPTLYINGEIVHGAMSEAQLRTIIDRALRDAGETVPAVDARAAPSAHSR